jgi:hypothetical protein
MGEFDKLTLAAGTVFNGRPETCRKALKQKELPAEAHYTLSRRVGASVTKRQ